MNSNQLLVVPNHIAKLASELSQFQWFLNDKDVAVSCDAIELPLNDEVAILLHDLKDNTGQVDALLPDIGESGLFVKRAVIENLLESLKESAGLLKKLRHLLDHHECSQRARKDAASLKEDYAFFGDELTRWLREHTPHRRFFDHSDDDDSGGSPVHSCDLPEVAED